MTKLIYPLWGGYKNEELKRKIFESLYGDGSDEEGENDVQQGNIEDDTEKEKPIESTDAKVENKLNL